MSCLQHMGHLFRHLVVTNRHKLFPILIMLLFDFHFNSPGISTCFQFKWVPVEKLPASGVEYYFPSIPPQVFLVSGINITTLFTICLQSLQVVTYYFSLTRFGHVCPVFIDFSILSFSLFCIHTPLFKHQKFTVTFCIQETAIELFFYAKMFFNSVYVHTQFCCLFPLYPMVFAQVCGNTTSVGSTNINPKSSCRNLLQNKEGLKRVSLLPSSFK